MDTMDRGNSTAFWRALDALVAASAVVVDRPRGSRHPRYPASEYPLDYGYLEGTRSGDGAGIDVWLGSRKGRSVTGIKASVMIYKHLLANIVGYLTHVRLLCYAVSVKLSAYAKQLGISYQTAWRMWQRGELPAHQLPSGTVIVDVPAQPQVVRPQKVAVYARVSSAENRTNLESQAERVAAFCAAKGWQVARIAKECGSGVNDQRPQLLALLSDTSLSHIVVEHKDRCSRFGVAYIQTLLKTQGRELVIVNVADEAEDGQEGKDDLLQDFVAIISSFCARLYGRRRASQKTTQLLAVLEAN
jgi:putative resolvase